MKNKCDNCGKYRKWSEPRHPDCKTCEKIIPYQGDERCQTCGKKMYEIETLFQNWSKKTLD